jgi:chemotaxis response regulator CheB
LYAWNSAPSNLPAAVLVVIHTSPDGAGMLPQVLSRAGALPAQHAVDGEAARQGRIYVAPPDRHLLIDRSALRLTHGPRENSSRPAVDPLFRTAAASYGPRVAGAWPSTHELAEWKRLRQATKRGKGTAQPEELSGAEASDQAS